MDEVQWQLAIDMLIRKCFVSFVDPLCPLFSGLSEHEEHKGHTKNLSAGRHNEKKLAVSIHTSFLQADGYITTGYSLLVIIHFKQPYLCKK